MSTDNTSPLAKK